MLLTAILAAATEIIVTIICVVFISISGEVTCVCGPEDPTVTPVVQPSPTPDCNSGVVTGDGIIQPCS